MPQQPPLLHELSLQQGEPSSPHLRQLPALHTTPGPQFLPLDKHRPLVASQQPPLLHVEPAQHFCPGRPQLSHVDVDGLHVPDWQVPASQQGCES